MSPLVESPDTVGVYGYASLGCWLEGWACRISVSCLWNVLLVVVFDSLVPSFCRFGNAALLFAAYGRHFLGGGGAASAAAVTATAGYYVKSVYIKGRLWPNHVLNKVVCSVTCMLLVLVRREVFRGCEVSSSSSCLSFVGVDLHLKPTSLPKRWSIVF